MKYCREGHFYNNVHRKDFPFDVEFALTYRCNLKCLHCYCLGSPFRKKELDTRGVKDVIDKLYRAGSLWLVLTGGEPLLRSDFLDIYSYAKKKGFLVTIFTNAVLLDRHILGYLRRFPPYSVEVTLNAITEPLYRKMCRCGHEAFLLARENIKIMAEAGLRVIVKTNLMTLNRKEFPLIKRWVLDSLGRRGKTYPFKFDFMLFPRLDGDKAPLRYRLNFKELRRILGADKDVEEQHIKELHRPFPEQFIDHDRLYQCNGWREQAFIDPYGRMKFCIFSDKYSVDLKKHDFVDGFRSIVAKVEIERFKTSSRCRACRLRSICGWCPERARLETGSEERPIPYFCRMTKSVAEATRRLRRDD
jgi:radical SAM protein with 4Fe4S-binding SPASM domain